MLFSRGAVSRSPALFHNALWWLTSAGVVIGIAVAAVVLGPGVAAICLAIVATAFAVVNFRLRRALATVNTQSTAAAPDGSGDVASVGVADLSHRMAPAHPISGLPVREALLARMAADQLGVLGALAFADFDRFSAFDPGLGERVFAASIERLRQMVPPRRFLAQVDRGQIGLWFGAEDEAAARAELEAISYALGEVIEIEGQQIVPQIKLRVARFDASSRIEAAAFLARTLASFALPAEPVANPERPTVDYAELARDRYTLERDLRQAAERHELSLVFQPLIDATEGRVSGAEALVRWDHPERGPVSPARFVPVMESMGLASEIGMWVLNAAVREARTWPAQGAARMRVAVNVSSLQLERDDLPLLVQRTLQHHELPPTALEIELTESVATSDAQHCRRIFEALRAMGVKLAVDDFGTGYSGFSALRTLAFDKIKIDREFVTDIDRRRDSQAICHSIIALGRGLGIRVLAEGIERREEYEWLRRHGCHHFQGYYFGAPMDGPAFTAFARDADRLSELLKLDAGPGRIKTKLRA